MLITSLNRELNEDDIYATRDSMRSAQNTDAFDKQWQIELEKSNPSIIRVILKLCGVEILLITFLYAILSVALR